LETYLAYAGLTDGEGKKFATNTPNEGRFHTKWMNMMYPRLYLAKNLLRDDGVIFISIDDNEVSNLRKMCDEIFGEENFISTIVWQRAFSPVNLKRTFSESHDFVVCYAKNYDSVEIKGLKRSTEAESRYVNPDSDPRGVWTSTDLSVGPAVPEKVYPITTPSGRVLYPPNGRCWVLTKERFTEFLLDNRIWFGKDGDNAPRIKKFLSEVKKYITPMTLWLREEVGDSQEATRELKSLFDGKSYMEYPKPVRLMKRLIELSSDSNEIIIDFFAGSCTTAHAVLELNKEEGMNRKFIMVQLPEPCDEESEACKAGYKTVADIGKERIRRVIRKIEEEQAAKANDPQMQLPGLEEERPQLDLGFKVFKLDRSNFRVWDGTDPEMPIEKLVEQLTLHADHINAEASQEDILYELLLKAGYPLTSIVEKMEMAGKTVYSIAEGALLICLEDEITRELIDAAAEAEPVQFICLDRGFKGNDQLKANAVQTFAARNQGRDKEKQIVFRTV
jgi:adenine-specific DNA-methyltransferase